MAQEDYLRPSPIRFDDGNYQICYKYWLRLKGERWAPAWREWDWNELPPALIPYFIVVDVQYDPLDFIYRFWGTSNMDMHGIDMTGMSVNDIRAEPTRKQTIQQYTETLECRQALGTSTAIQINADDPVYESISLRMPMSRDGKTIDMIVSFADWRQHHAAIKDNSDLRFGY